MSRLPFTEDSPQYQQALGQWQQMQMNIRTAALNYAGIAKGTAESVTPEQMIENAEKFISYLTEGVDLTKPEPSSIIKARN